MMGRRESFSFHRTTGASVPQDGRAADGGGFILRRSLGLVLWAAVWAVLLGPGMVSALPVPETYTDVRLVGSGSVSDTIIVGARIEFEYLGPYRLQVPKDIGAALAWMCFDAVPTMSLNQAWAAYLADDPQQAAALWYGPVDPYGLEKIHMIAWLSTQWAGASAAQLGSINEALWEITADYAGTSGSLGLSGGSFAVSSSSPFKAAASGYLAAAYSHAVLGGEDSPALFLLPLDTAGQPDHHIQPFVSPIPEPATLLLLSSGLVGVGGFAWKRCPRRVASVCNS